MRTSPYVLQDPLNKTIPEHVYEAPEVPDVTQEIDITFAKNGTGDVGNSNVGLFFMNGVSFRANYE